MPKRKRSRSADKGRKKHPENLFLTLSESRSTQQSEDQESEILQNLLTFEDGSKDRTISSDCRASIRYLLNFLAESDEEDSRDTSNGALSPTAIGLFLLPWAIKQLLSAADGSTCSDLLVWRTLSVCLEVLLNAEDSSVQQNLSQKILTQSTLFKLVPRVALFAVNPGDDDESASQPARVRTAQTSSSDVMSRRFAAASYESLVNRLFRPTLDVACKVLLIPIVAGMKLEEQQARTRILAEPPNPATQRNGRVALMATLGLIRTLQESGKGNPKTSFQLLATKAVLLSMSRAYVYLQQEDVDALMLSEIEFFEASNEGQSLIREILDDGLFHYRHHMDGFCSLLSMLGVPTEAKDTEPSTMDVEKSPAKKKHSFHCYQENLLSILTSSLCVPKDLPLEEEEICFLIHDIRDVAWLVPILYLGFVEAAKRMEENRDGKRKGSRKDDLTRLQFHIFAQMTLPLRKLLTDDSQLDDKSVSAVALRSLRECLGLVLEHDCYLPSHDKDTKQFAFLEAIVKELIEIEVSGEDFDGVQLLSDITLTFRLLILLNHRLLHERLVEIMSFLCVHCTDTRLQHLLSDFFATVVDTYTKLRQQSFIFSSFLGVFDALRREDMQEELDLLASLMKTKALASSIALAVQVCPVLELKSIFEAVEAWITSSLEFKPAKCLDIVVELNVIAMRNVRVDSGTASEVASICQRFADTSVEAILGERNDSSSAVSESTSAALTLCGWLLDLQTRCAFWLGRSAQLRIPSRIDNILETASNTLNKRRFSDARTTDATYEPVSDELLFLACHRLRQLHSLIHQQAREEFEKQSEEARVLRDATNQEARRLATFAALVAERQRDVSCCAKKSRWAIIAQNFASWAPYAEENHIDWFLNWIFSIITIDPLDPSLPSSSFAFRKVYDGLAEEIEVVQGIIQDASFFEESKVLSRFTLAALSSMTEQIEFMLRSWTTEDLFGDKEMRRLISPMVGSDGWERSKPAELVELADSCYIFDYVSDFETASSVAKLKRVLRSAMIVNGIEHPVCSLDDAMDSMDAIFRLDFLCRSLTRTDRAFIDGTLPLMSALRLLAAKIMESFPSDSFETILGSTDEASHLLYAFFTASRELLREDNSSFERPDGKTFLCSTARLAQNLTRDAVLTIKRPSSESSPSLEISSRLLKNVLVDMFTHHVNTEDFEPQHSELVFLAALGRAVLEGLDIARSEDDDTEGLDTRVNHSVWNALWEVISTLYPQTLTESTLRSYGLLLFGDLIRFWSRWNMKKWPEVELKDELNELCVSGIASENQSDDHRFACLYAVGCLVQTQPPTGMARRIVDQIVAAKETHPLLDAVFSELVRTFHGEELRRVVNQLTTNENSSNALLRLHILVFVVHYAKEPEQIELLAEFGREIFRVALQPLHADIGGELWAENVVKATDLIIDLIRRRDIVTLRDFDLALVLAHASAVLGPGGKDEESCPSEIYNACVRLLLSLFQRYPKQMYTCVPSVISTYHSLLRHVMYDDLSDEAIADRGQKFTRACEQLIGHREIYKKHVLGLVLEFVHGLESNIKLAAKESLLPAAYCLLDTMSSYETKQLNAIMNTRAKTLFRTVYQSYQKLHAYKGH